MQRCQLSYPLRFLWAPATARRGSAPARLRTCAVLAFLPGPVSRGCNPAHTANLRRSRLSPCVLPDCRPRLCRLAFLIARQPAARRECGRAATCNLPNEPKDGWIRSHLTYLRPTADGLSCLTANGARRVLPHPSRPAPP